MGVHKARHKVEHFARAAAIVSFTSLTSSGVERVEHRVIGGYRHEATPKSFARFASFWSKVAWRRIGWP
jgi:hypothetical protein